MAYRRGDYFHFLILTGERDIVSVSFSTDGPEPYFVDDLYEDFGDIYVLETGPDRESQAALKIEADSIYAGVPA